MIKDVSVTFNLHLPIYTSPLLIIIIITTTTTQNKINLFTIISIPMTSFVKLTLLLAISFAIVSCQVGVNCGNATNAYNTVNALYNSDPLQISSIALNTYYIPSYIQSACGGVPGAFGK